MDITAVGMATSLGTDAVTACAAARAGLTRPKELQGRFVFEPASGEMVPSVTHPVTSAIGFSGIGRLVQLGALGIQDLVRSAGLASEAIANSALFLALPSGYLYDAADAREALEDQADLPAVFESSELTERLKDKLERQLGQRMCELAGIPQPAHLELIFEDHAGGALAVQRALSMMRERGVERCVVGGIDTYCDESALDALELLRLLKTSGNPLGLAPGEASAFLLLEDRASTRANGGSGVELARFVSGGAHQLANDAHACTLLARLLGDVTRDLEEASSHLTIGSHNGTHAAASEWGGALATLPGFILYGEHWFPAAAFGDTGAASLLVGACIAVRALARGYAPSDRILLWGSSPRGSKGALRIMRRS